MEKSNVFSKFPKSKIYVFGKDDPYRVKKLEAIDIAFYRFATECYTKKLNVIFKGGCLIRHIFRSFDKINIRKTKDLDFDMCEEAYLIMSEEWENIRFSRLRSDLKSNAVLFDGGYDCDIQVLTEVDWESCSIYNCSEGKFYGARIEDILSDKIISASGKYITKRVKDLVDIANLITTEKIINSIDFTLLLKFISRKNIGNFEVFYTEKEQIRKELQDFHVKPDEVYRVISLFLEGVFEGKISGWTGSVWL